MKQLYDVYRNTLIAHPKIILGLFSVLLLVATLRLDQLRLDASAESLILENDVALQDFRETSKRFSSTQEFVLVTYTPEAELFSDEGLANLRRLRDQLAALEGVSNTNSILNVPLLHSPELTLDTVDSEIRTIDGDGVDPTTARKALLNNPFYSNLLLSTDGATTAIQVLLHTPNSYFKLFRQRADLKAQIQSTGGDAESNAMLSQLNTDFIALSSELHGKREALIHEIRTTIGGYQEQAEVHLGGVPMIVVDMVRFIESDVSTFGIGVLIFLLLTLAVIFRQWRWVLIPMLCCGFTVWLVSGYLAWTQWPITVISSNFISLLLIMTLSLTIHLIVRYREFQQDNPQDEAKQHLTNTIDAMIKPCFFMVITTIVAFCSFTLSDILPVIDFGWMMTLGLSIAFLITFVIFPAILCLLPPPADTSRRSQRKPFISVLAVLTEHNKVAVLICSLILAILSAVGFSRLTVENSFIDYFKKDTEIYKGMLAIDNRLGGTTPLDIVITDTAPVETAEVAEDCDPFVDDTCDESGATEDTWFTYAKVDRLEQVHNYLESLKETGKVLSITTTLRMLKQINRDRELTDVELAFVPKVVPDDLQSVLLHPYISEESRQARFTIRLLDSMPELRRQQLLDDIRSHLTNELGFAQEEVLLTGMTVMYNNMLQSLFDSQIKTLGIVFFAIMLMFLVLFRSFWLALIGIAPNMLAAGSLLGLMGWLNIPLDLMTITVAAITVGIAVDDTIHYIHRFKEELSIDGDYIATMHRCHSSIGTAMFYTSLTIIIGFSILVLSNFIPTIHFGIFTGFAMIVALLAALTLLPALIVIFKPFGQLEVQATTAS